MQIRVAGQSFSFILFVTDPKLGGFAIRVTHQTRSVPISGGGKVFLNNPLCHCLVYSKSVLIGFHTTDAVP
jgi:hypothetical protein